MVLALPAGVASSLEFRLRRSHTTQPPNPQPIFHIPWIVYAVVEEIVKRGKREYYSLYTTQAHTEYRIGEPTTCRVIVTSPQPGILPGVGIVCFASEAAACLAAQGCSRGGQRRLMHFEVGGKSSIIA